MLMMIPSVHPEGEQITFHHKHLHLQYIQMFRLNLEANTAPTILLDPTPITLICKLGTNISADRDPIKESLRFLIQQSQTNSSSRL